MKHGNPDSDFNNDLNNDDVDDDIEYVSKSQMKREMHALQDLGEKLVDLSDDNLNEMNLPEDLHKAVTDAKSMNQRGARRRQLQYIGKLMRRADGEKIQQQYDRITLHTAHSANQLHKIESWRKTLLDEGDSGLEAFLKEYPAADRQQIRQLVRSAIAEQKKNKPPRAFRNLFQLLKTYIG